MIARLNMKHHANTTTHTHTHTHARANTFGATEAPAKANLEPPAAENNAAAEGLARAERARQDTKQGAEGVLPLPRPGT